MESYLNIALKLVIFDFLQIQGACTITAKI